MIPAFSSSSPADTLYLPFSLPCHCIVSVFERKPLAGNLSENSAYMLICQQLYSPTQPSLITSQPDADTWLFTCVCVCVFVFISASLFAVGHFSLEWDFVSGAHWLALGLGSKTHLGVLWTEREKYCQWWSRLWSDSLVLSSASSHYTANTHRGSVASLFPWIRPDFYLVNWELANSCCTINSMARQTVLPCIYICLAVDQFWYNRLGHGKVRFSLLQMEITRRCPHPEAFTYRSNRFHIT